MTISRVFGVILGELHERMYAIVGAGPATAYGGLFIESFLRERLMPQKDAHLIKL